MEIDIAESVGTVVEVIYFFKANDRPVLMIKRYHDLMINFLLPVCVLCLGRIRSKNHQYQNIKYCKSHLNYFPLPENMILMVWNMILKSSAREIFSIYTRSYFMRSSISLRFW